MGGLAPSTLFNRRRLDVKARELGIASWPAGPVGLELCSQDSVKVTVSGESWFALLNIGALQNGNSASVPCP